MSDGADLCTAVELLYWTARLCIRRSTDDAAAPEHVWSGKWLIRLRVQKALRE
jgi:hypothetical protein